MAVTINGSAGVTTNSGAVYNGLQTDTAKSATGTSVDFTGIPSWVKRVTVMFNGVSTTGISAVLVQLGAGSVTTSGYLGSANSANFTTGFSDGIANASALRHGAYTVQTLGGNVWQCAVTMGTSGVALSNTPGGFSISLGGTLDRVRITTVNGTDTFDAGTINIIYE